MDERALARDRFLRYGEAMLHAHSVRPAGSWSGEPADSIVLDYDERYRRRIAMTGVRGLAFLPGGVTGLVGSSHGNRLLGSCRRLV